MGRDLEIQIMSSRGFGLGIFRAAETRYPPRCMISKASIEGCWKSLCYSSCPRCKSCNLRDIMDAPDEDIRHAGRLMPFVLFLKVHLDDRRQSCCGRRAVRR